MCVCLFDSPCLPSLLSTHLCGCRALCCDESNVPVGMNTSYFHPSPPPPTLFLLLLSPSSLVLTLWAKCSVTVTQHDENSGGCTKKSQERIWVTGKKKDSWTFWLKSQWERDWMKRELHLLRVKDEIVDSVAFRAESDQLLCQTTLLFHMNASLKVSVFQHFILKVCTAWHCSSRRLALLCAAALVSLMRRYLHPGQDFKNKSKVETVEVYELEVKHLDQRT